MRFEVDGRAAFAYTGSRALDAALPSVALVHGTGLDHSVWELQSRWLAHHGYNVLALDLPAHGRSQGPPLETIEALADWVAAALSALSVDRAALVGHSMGALIALDAAARHEARVSAVSLLGIALPMTVSDQLLDAARADAHDALDMINVWGHARGVQLGANPAPGMWMSGGAIRLLERARPGIVYRDLHACNAYRAGSERAKSLTCPVQIILGRGDQMAPPRLSRALIDVIPNAALTELECGHMLMNERPDEVLDALAEFLRSHAR